MSETAIENVNLAAQDILLSPSQLKADLPVSTSARKTIIKGRQAVNAILNRQDHRLMLVIGPCSIHDTEAAMDYAHRLKKLADEVQDTIAVVMRVYFEKPRTTVGWKGLINDPHLNGSFNIEEGLHIGRKLLLDIAEIGLPTATEALDPISPQYLHDLISWSAIGARTTESQTHREMASGLSCAVGFKNGTDGSLKVALNALQSVSNSHHFLGINSNGQVAVIRSNGNPYAHVVLRGGSGKPNYDSVSVALCEQELKANNMTENIMVDCSHENSNKNHELQPLVMDNIVNQILEGNRSIIGLMVESNIGAGNQKIQSDHTKMQYGVSVTDKCIDWETTVNSLRAMHHKLKNTLRSR
ncbi:MAG: 3-deoxy-7-phosphoheptulonate synthase [Cellvibrionaceae bacterium]|nr:3-deoxy-7-phosphoheptulonate synthase [Cellvibrionaceae bacterium]